MGIFDFAKKHSTTTEAGTTGTNVPWVTPEHLRNQQTQKKVIPSTLIKEQAGEEIAGKISLVKKDISKVFLEKPVLQKNPVAQITFFCDCSGSMMYLYSSNKMQRCVERALALGLTFDADGEIDMYGFDDQLYDEMPKANISNINGYADKYLKPFGGTSYMICFDTILENFKKNFDGHPWLVVIITDGDPNDNKDKLDEKIIELSYYPIDFVIITVGRDKNLPYIDHINNDLNERYVDNIGAFAVTDPAEISIAKICEEYATWLELDKVKQMLGRA